MRWLMVRSPEQLCFFFFFNDTATTEIYTLSLHDALPISSPMAPKLGCRVAPAEGGLAMDTRSLDRLRSEEHTSELQSQSNLVCRLLLEKKKFSLERFHSRLIEQSDIVSALYLTVLVHLIT